MIYKGLKFGMLLQLAIGPMCLMVFNSSVSQGLLAGLTLVVAIAAIDALYIALSAAGIAVVLSRSRVKTGVKIFGCAVLTLFGLNMICGAFAMSFLPAVALFSPAGHQHLFIQGLLLTASNPLTIIFWGGVFSTQVAEHQLNRSQLFYFGLGCVLAPLIFMTLVALLGSMFGSFLPPAIIRALNAAVGLLLIFFGIKLLLKK